MTISKGRPQMTNLYDPLSGEMPWPLFVRPQQDEILSSWVARLAYNHNMTVLTFCYLGFSISYVLDRDIDKSAKREFMELLARKTETYLETALKCTFTAFMGNGNDRFANRWLLSFGEFNGQRKRYTLQFCPYCLRKDRDKPYFRKQWRLSIMTECISCGHNLLDECPNCGSAISFMSKGKKPIPICICNACGMDISKAKSAKSEDGILQLQRTVIEKTDLNRPARPQWHLNELSSKIGQATHNYQKGQFIDPGLKGKFHLMRCSERREIMGMIPMSVQ